MATDSTKLKLPNINLGGVEQLRDRLYEHVFQTYEGTEIKNDVFVELVDRVRLRMHTVPRRVLELSMLTLLGRSMTFNLAMGTAWRLAGNMPRLKNSVPIDAWTRQAEAETVPVQIIEVRRQRNRWNKQGYELRKRIMAGTPAGELVMRWVSHDYACYLAFQIGFSRKINKGVVRLYTDAHELTSMRLFVRLDPVFSKDGQLTWRQWGISTPLKRWNQEVMLARQKVTPPCPIAARHPCKVCYLGTDACIAGCHPRTYEQRQCVQCKALAYCDPANKLGWCINCAATT